MRFALPIGALILLLAAALPGAGRSPAVTSYAQMTLDLKADAARSPFIHLASVGESARGRKDIWLARASDPAALPQNSLRILILCRQHGDEPASTQAALQLLHGLAAGYDPGLQRDLKQVALYLVPMVNPDGADAMTRRNGVGADLNRDWVVFSQPETQAVARAARLIRPQVVIDAHNWDGSDPYNANCVEAVRSDATPLERATHAVQQEAAQDLAASGFGVNRTTYGAGLDGRLAHRYFTRQGVISLLVETHSGDPADADDFQRRRAFYLALIHGLSHHFAQATPAERLALGRAEGAWTRTNREGSLFAPPSAAGAAVISALAPPRRVWLWALCVFGLVLWIGGLCRPHPGLTPHDGSRNTRRRATSVPAGRRLVAGRRKPRYRHSQSSPGFRPAPVASTRREQPAAASRRPGRDRRVLAVS